MESKFSRRQFIQATAAGGLATLGLGGGMRGAAAAEPVRAVIWGVYLKHIQELTARQSESDVEWHAFGETSGEIIAKAAATWPNVPFELAASWAPHYHTMWNSGWLDTVTVDEAPNLADVPQAMLGFNDGKGGVFGVPNSAGANLWGYRTDLVEKPIKDIDDLFDPSLKGKICIPCATYANNVLVLSLALHAGGDEYNMEPGWKLLKELIKTGNVGRVSCSDADLVNSITTGETAVLLAGFASWNTIKQSQDVVTLAKVPGSKGIKAFMYTEGWVVFKGPRSGEAKRLVNHLLSAENNSWFNEQIGQLPANGKAKVPDAARDIAMTPQEFDTYAYFPDYVVLSKEVDNWAKYWEREIQPLLRGG